MDVQPARRLGWFAIVVIAAVSSGNAQQFNASASPSYQPPTTGWRSVPQIRSSEIVNPQSTTNPTPHSPRRPGWNLRWRSSGEADRRADHAISQQAFAAPQRQTVSTSDVETVVYQAQAQAQSSFVLPTEPAPSPTNPSPINQLRGDSIESMLPPPAPNTIDPAVPPPSIPAPAPTPEMTLPNEASMRDFLEDAEPIPAPAQPEIDDQELPNKGVEDRDINDFDRNPESPSDLERFDPNPFGVDALSEQDRDDDPMDLDVDPRSVDDSEIGLGDRSPGNLGNSLSCDEFRQRILRETIDQVSLDISPPFRPDIIDQAEYEELKSEFDAETQPRTWRNIEGKPLATGRLTDLAYEEVVIITDFGTRETIPMDELSESDLAFISSNWGLPTECLLPQSPYEQRNWNPQTVVWAASNLCHKPLYFEEVNLERYGHTAGPLAQPIVSSAHFFLNIAVLPYKMGVHSPHECQYALGYYRPGNCAPWIIPPVPLSVKGAWYQAAAISGTALLVP